MTRPKDIDARREALGISYRKLAEHIGERASPGEKSVSYEAIRITLRESASIIPMDRDRIMDEVERALDEIEREQQEEEDE